ncbi:MAG: LytTR family DNA-binding domain-containing protein [Clostridia bacterium]
MYNIAICDDNKESCYFIAKSIESSIINNKFDAEITLITNEQNKIYEKILKDEIDILFLDIDFKDIGKNGIEFAEDLRKINKKFYLIFCSAHSKYIPISFHGKTFDFITKPLYKDVIENVIIRLKEDLEENNIEYLHISKGRTIKCNSILCIEKAINKCDIYTTYEKISTTATINNILTKLPKNFVKCHRSYIINTDKIETYDKSKNMILLENNKKCPTSSNFIFKGGENNE